MAKYIETEAVEDKSMAHCDGCGEEHHAYVLHLSDGKTTIEVMELCAPEPADDDPDGGGTTVD